MLQGRPLYDTSADERFFVDPVGWPRLIAAVDHGFNVAVITRRGGGATTALRQLQRRLRQQGAAVAFVDATQIRDVAQLVGLVEAAVTGPRGALRELRDDAALAVTGLAGGPPGATSLRLVHRLRALSDLPPTTFLVDCAHAVAAGNDLFGRLRDELWHLPHRWVVAVADSERSVLLAPPAGSFFEQVVPLEWTPAHLESLLRERDPALAGDLVARVASSASTPRDALQLVRDALTDPAGGDPLAAAFWRQEEAARLGRPHSMALAELEAIGGASASDTAFLQRTGWTRPRAVQVLKELEQARLVTATDEAAPGGGRPRRVYRPAAPPPGSTLPAKVTELEVREP